MIRFRGLWSALLVVTGSSLQAGQLPPESPSCPVSDNPVHLIEQWKFLERTDIEAPIKFARMYTSGGRPDELWGSSLGSQWTHSYSRRLSSAPAHPLPDRLFDRYVVRDDGTAVLFSTEKFKPHMCGFWFARQPGSGSLEGVCGNDTVVDYFVYRDSGGEERYAVNGRLLQWIGADGVRLTFTHDPQGRLWEITNDSGRRLSFNYVSGRLNGVSSANVSVSYGYSTNGVAGQLSSVTGGLRPEIYEYAIATKPRLMTSVKDLTGTELLSISYDPASLNGRVASTSSWSAPGIEVNRFEYSPIPGGINIKNPLGLDVAVMSSTVNIFKDGEDSRDVKVVEGRSSNCSSCGSDGFQSMTYDADANVDLATDFNGNVTDFDYSPDGLLLRKVEAKGTPLARTSMFVYDEIARVEIGRFVCAGDVPVCEKSSLGLKEMLTKRLTAARGVRPAAECRHDVNSSSAKDYDCGAEPFAPLGVLQTVYRYCSASDPGFGSQTCPLEGRLMSVDGPRGDVSDVTVYYYHTTNVSSANCLTGQCYRKGDLSYVQGPFVSSGVAYLSYNSRGQPLRVRDANNTETIISYDAVGRTVSRSIAASGASPVLFDSVEYDALGQVVRIFKENGAGVEYCRDQAQRITAEVNVQRGGPTGCQGAVPKAGFEAVKYTLDAAGNRTREVVFNSKGQEVRVLAQTYTSESRLFESFRSPYSLGPLAPNAKRTTHTYDGNGNVLTVTDPLGRVTRSEYDALSRLERVIEDFGGASKNLNATTVFGYDTLGQLRTVQDAEGLVTEYVFNGLQRQAEVRSPDAGTQIFTHDGAGNIRTKTDARGVVVIYSYDAANRLNHVDYPGAAIDAVFEHDSADAVCTAGGLFAQGKVGRMVDASGSTVYCYDARGNLVRKRQTTAGAISEVQYVYDSANQLDQVIYPSRLVADYSRDARGRVASIALSLPEQGWEFDVASQISYLPNGPLSSIAFDDTQSLTKAWDKNYDPDGIGGSLLSLDLAVNDLGLINGINGVSYAYDSLNRLQSVSSPTGSLIEGFQYDKIGNRTAYETNLGLVGYGYQSGSHRLTAVGGVGRSYDAAGNTLSGHLPPTFLGQTRQTFYDERGRLAEFRYKEASGALVTEYQWTYNERGERVRTRRVNALAPLDAPLGSEFLFDENAQLLSEKVVSAVAEGGGSRIPVDRYREIVWVDNVPVAFVVSRGTLPDIYYIHSDHLNTPRALTRAHEVGGSGVGTLAWEWQLAGNGVSAFGAHDAVNHPNNAGYSVEFSLRFPGQQLDSFSGFSYNYMRAYDPKSGRYLESDPIGLDGGISTYTYVGSLPIMLIDPFGLASCGPGNTPPPPKDCTKKKMRGLAQIITLLVCLYEGKTPPSQTPPPPIRPPVPGPPLMGPPNPRDPPRAPPPPPDPISRWPR